MNPIIFFEYIKLNDFFVFAVDVWILNRFVFIGGRKIFSAITILKLLESSYSLYQDFSQRTLDGLRESTSHFTLSRCSSKNCLIVSFSLSIVFVIFKLLYIFFC